MKIAVQVYSVRDHISDPASLIAALAEIKRIGYDGVEFAGYYGADAAEIRKALDDLGLVAVGGHIGLDDFKPDKLEETLAFQRTLGVPCVGVGGAPHSTLEECEETGKVLGDAQRISGMPIYYHNHSEEFIPLPDGRLPIDVIGSFCSLEIDTYWSFHAGVDNASFLRSHADNIVHLHVKDGVGGHPKALGEGECDLDAVLDAAQAMGMEWLIVENDDPVPTGFEDITRSLAYIKSKLK
ncbi:MAG: sugar phosphate isomerase/epimerase [Clostridia bacterium]|nr:sugar phosphate isomerase/epimerase [Clostridia bacterium]